MTKNNENANGNGNEMGIDPEMIKKMKSVLENGDMAKNLSQIAGMLSEPKKAEAVKNLISNKALQRMQEQSKAAESASSLDPRVNLLLAIKPFLSTYRAEKVDRVVKSVSLTTLLRDLNKII